MVTQNVPLRASQGGISRKACPGNLCHGKLWVKSRFSDNISSLLPPPVSQRGEQQQRGERGGAGRRQQRARAARRPARAAARGELRRRWYPF